MITFGTVSLFTSNPSMNERAPGCAEDIARYMRDWDRPIEAAYANTMVGERALVYSLAPGGRHATWIVSLDGSDTSVEAANLQVHADGVRIPQTIRGPILMAISFWAGPTAVPHHTVGNKYPPLPRELIDLAHRMAAIGRVTVDQVMDEYWRSTADGHR